MDEQKVKVELHIKKSTLNRIDKIIQYHNLMKEIHNEDFEDGSVEDFIKGSIMNELSYIEFLSTFIDDQFNGNKIQNNFKQILKEQGYTLKGIEEKTKIPMSNLSRILNNHHQPTLDYFFRLYRVSGFPPLQEVIYRK